MSSAVRFALLSDLHVWRAAEPDSWALALQALDAAANAGVDHVILAGDVFDCATAFEEDSSRLRAELVRRRLWSSRRLTIVVGNHDIFHTPHHGGTLRKLREYARIPGADAQGNYDAFCEWAGDLVSARDRLDDDDDLFPFAKQIGHVVLFAADTTGPDTAYSVNGYWSPDDDEALRRVETNGLRSVLAIHHPPEQDEERHLVGQAREGYAFGFPRSDFRRLTRFADDYSLDAVVCGHIHDNGGEPWTWTFGDGTRAFMMGRTGGVHGASPVIGILEVPERGAVKWRIRRV
jgi:predicted phosphodiesterase